jgi:hypothetical protein
MALWRLRQLQRKPDAARVTDPEMVLAELSRGYAVTVERFGSAVARRRCVRSIVTVPLSPAVGVAPASGKAAHLWDDDGRRSRGAPGRACKAFEPLLWRRVPPRFLPLPIAPFRADSPSSSIVLANWHLPEQASDRRGRLWSAHN